MQLVLSFAVLPLKPACSQFGPEGRSLQKRYILDDRVKVQLLILSQDFLQSVEKVIKSNLKFNSTAAYAQYN